MRRVARKLCQLPLVWGLAIVILIKVAQYDPEETENAVH